MQLLKNFLDNPKTTLAGVWGGASVLAGGAYLLNAMHCDLSLVTMQTLIGILTAMAAVPVVAGGMMKDTKKEQPPTS